MNRGSRSRSRRSSSLRRATMRSWFASPPQVSATPTCASRTESSATGRWPLVLGHEGAGVVEAVGVGGDARRDRRPCRLLHRPFVPCVRRVLSRPLPPLHPGGRERPPRRPDGRHLAAVAPRRHAASARTDDGVLRGADGRAAAGAVPLPRDLPLWQASLLGCGVVTAFGAVRNAARVTAGESAAVIGCGGVGLQVIAALRLPGADPIVAVDLDPAKLDLALARARRDAVESGSAATAARVTSSRTGGADHAFEVVGRPETCVSRGTACARAEPRSSSASHRRESRSGSLRSSSSPTRQCAARTTARATPPPISPARRAGAGRRPRPRGRRDEHRAARRGQRRTRPASPRRGRAHGAGDRP